MRKGLAMSNLFFIFVLSNSNNMEILFYILCGGIGIGFGTLVGQSVKPKCNHVWEKIEDGRIHRYVNGNKMECTGFIKVYECQRCKKMRKEQTMLDW